MLKMGIGAYSTLPRHRWYDPSQQCSYLLRNQWVQIQNCVFFYRNSPPVQLTSTYLQFIQLKLDSNFHFSTLVQHLNFNSNQTKKSETTLVYVGNKKLSSFALKLRNNNAKIVFNIPTTLQLVFLHKISILWTPIFHTNSISSLVIPKFNNKKKNKNKKIKKITTLNTKQIN